VHNHQYVIFAIGLSLGASACVGEPADDTSGPFEGEVVGSAQQAATVGPGCVTLQRGGVGNAWDTSFAQANGSWAAGTYAGGVWTGGTGGPASLYYAAFKFDLGPVPADANITSATFQVYAPWNNQSSTVRAHAMAVNWNEATATYASVGGASGYSAPVLGSFDPKWGANGIRTVDITPLAKAWMDGSTGNFGLALEEPLGIRHAYYVSESTNPAFRPSLTVCWDGPINVDDCAPNPCQNGGVCTDGVDSYTCACPPGFSGADCETAVVACPCAGTGFADSGPILWPHAENMTCTYDAEHIFVQTYWQSPFREFGSGIGENGQPYCFMHASEFDGSQTCDVSLITAEQEAACRQQILDWGTFECFGLYGLYNGPTDTCDPCLPNPCQNGATCNAAGSSYTCDCAGGYSGVDCEL
jgi:hypothetical protein